VALVSQANLIEASRLRDQYQFSYWDSLIVACALAEGAAVAYSEDMNAGLLVENRLQIINPFAA
jgi:predicted nucleic acid-binding protein